MRSSPWTVGLASPSREASSVSFLALWLAVGVLGGIGAIARFLLYSLISSGGARIPLGTLGSVKLPVSVAGAHVGPNASILPERKFAA